jgi:hypothetical protein
VARRAVAGAIAITPDVIGGSGAIGGLEAVRARAAGVPGVVPGDVPVCFPGVVPGDAPVCLPGVVPADVPVDVNGDSSAIVPGDDPVDVNGDSSGSSPGPVPTGAELGREIRGSAFDVVSPGAGAARVGGVGVASRAIVRSPDSAGSTGGFGRGGGVPGASVPGGGVAPGIGGGGVRSRAATRCESRSRGGGGGGGVAASRSRGSPGTVGGFVRGAPGGGGSFGTLGVGGVGGSGGAVPARGWPGREPCPGPFPSEPDCDATA